MATHPPAPAYDLERVSEAESRLFGTVRALDDTAMRATSLLPDWSVGHLLTHLARNADSHVRRTEASVEGVMVDQYPGGPSERAAEIEAGAGRRAATIAEDVAVSSARMLEAWAGVPDRAWSGVTRDASGLERPLAQLPGRRWFEVEVHLVDLGHRADPPRLVRRLRGRPSPADPRRPGRPAGRGGHRAPGGHAGRAGRAGLAVRTLRPHRPAGPRPLVVTDTGRSVRGPRGHRGGR